MSMYDICCIGHITSDKVVTPGSVVNMPGGTAFYFSKALQHFDARYKLVTSVGNAEMHFVSSLKDGGTEVLALTGSHTVCFENIYDANQDNRVQKVSQKADPFSIQQVRDIDAAVFHLGPLLADDIPVELIQFLSAKGKVSLDIQGYLREVRGTEVFPVDWLQKREALQFVHTLKTNESETRVLTGIDNVRESARLLSEWGAQEVVITLGSMGSLIYAEKQFYEIPAYKPTAVVDATGCGDTYMAGYLYCRNEGLTVEASGKFAAAMATIKIQASGPFAGTKHEVLSLLDRSEY